VVVEENGVQHRQLQCRIEELDACEIFEDSSSEKASKRDSMKRNFDPTRRQMHLTPELVKSERMDRLNLLTDIGRCQDQVEELIALFRNLNARNARAAKPNAPRPRQSYATRLTQRGAHVGPRRSIDLENARTHLAQSLEDALKLLERFPRERDMIRRSETPSGATISPMELLDAVDRMERMSHEGSGEISERPSSAARSLSSNRKRNADSRGNDRLPVLRETLSCSSAPCSTPNEICQIHRRQGEATYLTKISPFEEISGRHSSDSYFWNVFTSGMSQRSSPPFRVFFQAPIRFGTLSPNSSQSLSGLETSFAIRIQTHLERDALSDSELLNQQEDLSLLRRTNSAIAALCPSDQPHTLDRQRSMAASTDWDVVEDGISVRDTQSHHLTLSETPERNENELDQRPGRLSPEVVQWTSTAFSTLEFRPQSHVVEESPLLTTLSRLSNFSEMNKNVSQQQCRIDRSVQCDISSQSTTMVPWTSGCGIWFKKKKKKPRELRKSTTLPSKLQNMSEEDSLPDRSHVTCGFRTAVRAALRPSCPNGKREVRSGSSSCLYKGEESDTVHFGPSAA